MGVAVPAPITTIRRMADEATPAGTIHDDLFEMLEATRVAERAIYEALDPPVREAPGTIGDWSAKDVLAHLAAWREVEAERLRTGWHDRTHDGADEPAGETEDDASARIQAERAAWTWQHVADAANTSLDELQSAIAATPAEILERSEHMTAGIGAHGADHALAHLADVANLAGPAAEPPFSAFERRIEAILRRGRIPERDVGVLLYNLGCNAALAGRLDDARRLVGDGLRRRPDLLDWALEDPDLASIRGELRGLAGG